MPGPKSEKVRLSVFKGREAKLNHAILQVLSKASPLAIWDIHKNAGEIRGFKGTKYAVINARIKALEEEGYLKRTGKRNTKQGGKTTLYTLSAKTKLAMELNSQNIDDMFNKLDEESALAMLDIISHANGTN